MKNFVSALILLVIITSCKNTSDQRNNKDTSLAIEDSLYKEVMRVHDEMMPKMQDIIILKSKLSVVEDSLVKIDSALALPYTNSIKNLLIADNAMMGWMHQFEPTMDSLSQEEKIAYLTIQKSKMDSVKIVMQSAIDSGKSLLK